MFFHFGEVTTLMLIVLVIALASALFWFTRRRKSLARIVGAITAVPLGMIGTLAFGIFLLTELGGCSGHGEPIYSPNGKSAAMIWFHDEGAIGGGSYVDLYDTHGLHYASAFDGEWKAVDQTDVQWNDDTHLTIHYDHRDGYDEQKTCKDFRAVKVTCIPK